MDDQALLAAFRTQTLAHDEWTHEAHLRIAYCHLREAPFQQAMDRMRSGILALNDAHGTPNTESGGYHESLTTGWLRMVGQAMASSPEATDSLSLLAAHPQLHNKRTILCFYSRELIMSAHARAAFVEPDLEALPDTT